MGGLGGNQALERLPAEGPTESPRFMWAMAAALFAAGASVGALSLIVPHPESFDDAALWSNIAISYIGAVLCLLAAPRLPAWPLHILVLGGVAAVTRAIYFTDDPGGFYTLFYVWIGFYVIFFFPRAVALLYMAAIGLAYGWLLLVLDASSAVAHWVTAMGTILLGAFLIESLVARLRRAARESAELARERAELMSTLAEVARTDDLTGLPNRRAWDEALEREITRARRESTPLCIGLVDLDRFKHYNDDHGHQAGDRLLKEIAAAWRSELRTTDVLARYGGEEFAIALPGCDARDASLLVERLRASTPKEQTCSAGLVIWDGEETTERIFGRADKALYEAKETGRDRIVAA